MLRECHRQLQGSVGLRCQVYLGTLLLLLQKAEDLFELLQRASQKAEVNILLGNYVEGKQGLYFSW
jgi:hypothetical protein